MGTQETTRRHLLEAAGEEFARVGFEEARVRTICERAGVNLAAPSYHFGDKRQLYIEAVLEAHRCGAPMAPDSDFEGLEPPDELRLFIRLFLLNIVAMNHHDTWHRTLMMREILQPTEACGALVRESIRPRFERLLGILGRMCPGAESRRLHALAFSVIGQCLHYKMARAVTERLISPEELAALDVDYLTDHIATVCLAAIGLAPPLEQTGSSKLSVPVPVSSPTN